MKFKITPATCGWYLYIWDERLYPLPNQEPNYWSLQSHYNYKWQAKRAAKHLATPEEVFEIA